MHKVALNFSDGRTHFISINPGEMLIDAALRHGLTLPVDCREGVCASCKGTCQSGQYDLEYVDEDALSEDDLARGGILACQMRVESDCAVRFDFDSSLCSSAGPEVVEAVVAKVEVLSDSTATLHLDASGRKGQLDFLPGQYAHVQVPGTDEWRSYSFACEPNESNQLQLLIRLLPDGVMSNYLRENAQPGDQIRLKAPLGAFYLHQVKRPLVMVAGGDRAGGLSGHAGSDGVSPRPRQSAGDAVLWRDPPRGPVRTGASGALPAGCPRVSFSDHRHAAQRRLEGCTGGGDGSV